MGSTAARAVAVAATAVLMVGACSSDDGGDVALEGTTTSAPATTTTTEAPSTTATTEAPAEPAAWQPVDAGATTPPPRSGAVLAAAPDGTLWLHGGHVGPRAPR